ncbi:DUF5989 family protein [Nannocystis sp.]|uniref:DUF5989 family protein n=1 Tax=Nannocystis sp. TaxID=1962667 RepID=UPI002427B6B4|nr:DUF5989 family protein [Nannocystis sp.]MBK7827597.1 hypothetical protein [Nannocystis sp.]MBK9756476.1 hypothetical protein [Nannocystis sp.]
MTSPTPPSSPPPSSPTPPDHTRARFAPRPPPPGLARRLAARLRTAARLIFHFLHPARFILAPLLIVLLLAGILLSLTGGLAYVAPFVYTLF